jgi:transcriptional regulator with XRE-family HTH domain
MNLAEKIQKLRMQNNMSQEQLADTLSVSRQAISKWESAQSVPELNNVLQISELFHVSTDYLLKESTDILPKGKELLSTLDEKSPAQALMAIATGLILFGLIASLGIWIQWQTSLAIPIGVGVQLLGLVIVEALSSRKSEKNQFHRKFYSLNCWFLLPLPLMGLISLGAHLFPRPYSRLAIDIVGIGSYGLLGFIFRYFIKNQWFRN